MSYTLLKPYTEKQYFDFVSTYNHELGLRIEDAPSAVYALEADEILKDGVPVKNPDYEKELLAQEKEEKLNLLSSLLLNKQNDPNSTVTLNVPVTLRKGTAEVPATSFKLLTVTSAGALSNVLMGYSLVASKMDIPDLLVTSNGYTIVGLNQKDASGLKLIDLIFAQYTNVAANITTYFRQTKDEINSAETLEELSKISVDFDQF